MCKITPAIKRKIQARVVIIYVYIVYVHDAHCTYWYAVYARLRMCYCSGSIQGRLYEFANLYLAQCILLNCLLIDRCT